MPTRTPRRAVLALLGALVVPSVAGLLVEEPRVPRVDGGGTPWPAEVQSADLHVRGALTLVPGERAVQVILAPDRESFAAMGGSDAVPGFTRGLVATDATHGSAGTPRGHVQVVLHPAVADLSAPDRALVLRHELVHARFDQLIPPGEPDWWREGMAEWVAHSPSVQPGGLPPSGGGAPAASAVARECGDRAASDGPGAGAGTREQRYAAAHRAVSALAAAGRGQDLVVAVDRAWGSPGLRGAVDLPAWLRRHGVPQDTAACVGGLVARQAD